MLYGSDKIRFFKAPLPKKGGPTVQKITELSCSIGDLYLQYKFKGNFNRNECIL